jgi:hypothetical protein
MAFDRIGPTTAPLGPLERQSQHTGPAPAPALGEDGVYPLAPRAPGAVDLLPDGGEGRPQPRAQAGMDALFSDKLGANDPAAMRPNQLFMSRQLVWQQPDTNAMAASWFVMVRTYGAQRDALLQQAAGQHVPASLFMADHTPNSLREGRPGLPLVTEMEPWRFAVYAWGAEKLVLKVVAKDGDSEQNRRRRRRVALRLELMLPGVGRVVIQMEPAGSGVVLEVGAQQSSAMQHMREMLPLLASTVSRSGLTILRCRLLRELAPNAQGAALPTREQIATLTKAMFKAMAEVAVLLSQPLPPDDLFSETA